MWMDSTVRLRLERWVRAATTPQRLVRRSRIALLVMDGVSPDQIAEQVGVSQKTVALWTERFQQGGPDALQRDAPGRGRPSSLAPETVRARLVEADLLGPNGQPTNLRRAAAALGVSVTALWRALRKPHAPTAPSLDVTSRTS